MSDELSVGYHRMDPPPVRWLSKYPKDCDVRYGWRVRVEAGDHCFVLPVRFERREDAERARMGLIEAGLCDRVTLADWMWSGRWPAIKRVMIEALAW